MKSFPKGSSQRGGKEETTNITQKGVAGHVRSGRVPRPGKGSGDVRIMGTSKKEKKGTEDIWGGEENRAADLLSQGIPGIDRSRLGKKQKTFRGGKRTFGFLSKEK